MMTLRDVVNSLTAQDKLGPMIDCINILISLGLEPTGFKMDANELARLLEYNSGKGIDFIQADENGIVNVYNAMTKYTYSILGIPIEPLYRNKNRIEVRAKSIE